MSDETSAAPPVDFYALLEKLEADRLEKEQAHIPLADMWSGKIASREIIGTIGVDSGTVMIIDPCYVIDGDDDNRERYMDATSFVGTGARHHEWNLGVVSSTLYGDGGYPVIAEKNAVGNVVRLIIDFGSEGVEPLLAEYEDDDDDEEDGIKYYGS